MKHARIALILALLFTLCGCDAGQRSLLWYQDTLIWAELDDGERVWRITPGAAEDDFTAELTSPAAVAGVTFTVAGDTAYASLDGVRIPVGERMMLGARRAMACLSLSENMLTEVETVADEAWTVLAHFFADGETYTVAFDADGLPLWIEMGAAENAHRYTVLSLETTDTKDTEYE